MKIESTNPIPIPPKAQAEIDALAALPDDQIKTDDIPEVRDWSGAKQEMLYRPIKKQITLRLDADSSSGSGSSRSKGRVSNQH